VFIAPIQWLAYVLSKQCASSTNNQVWDQDHREMEHSLSSLGRLGRLGCLGRLGLTTPSLIDAETICVEVEATRSRPWPKSPCPETHTSSRCPATAPRRNGNSDQ
jgi:hypothetical protein